MSVIVIEGFDCVKTTLRTLTTTTRWRQTQAYQAVNWIVRSTLSTINNNSILRKQIRLDAI